MDSYASVLGPGVLRAMVLLVVPGAFVVLPWIGCAYVHDDAFKHFIDSHVSVATTTVVLLVLAAGMMLTTIGSRIEVRWDSIRNAVTKNRHTDDWYAYLRTAWEPEPVGYRYLSDVVLSLRFELSFGVALFAGPAIALPAALGNCWGCLFGLTSIGLGAYMIWESKETNQVLGELRSRLLAGVARGPGGCEEPRLRVRPFEPPA